MPSLFETTQFLVKGRETTLQWLSHQFITKKLMTPFGVLFLLTTAVVVGFVTAQVGYKYAFLLLLMLFGIGYTLFCTLYVELTFYAAVLFSPIVFSVSKYYARQVPIGVFVDGILILGITLIILNEAIKRNTDWSFVSNAISISFGLYVLYVLVQILNPNLHSLEGYFATNRRLLSFVAVYVIVSYSFRDIHFLRRFVWFWIGFAFLSALYGCWQEWFGLFTFERRWLLLVESAYEKIFVGGRYRIFSFHSGPASFGVFMAMTCVFCVAMAAGNSKKINKLIYIVVGTFCTLGLAYSGTRTAYAMVIGGLVLFVLMTINKKTTLIIASLITIAFGGLVVGPFYGNPIINRVRSVVEGGNDASMNVRNINRSLIQPYIYNHPIGGGIGTSGSSGLSFDPNHELAGFPPDSGYLQAAIETGWIGLLIFMIFCATFLIVSIRNFYRIEDPLMKTYAIAISVCLFSLVLGLYAQESAISMIPEGLFFWGLLGIAGNMVKVANDNKKFTYEEI